MYKIILIFVLFMVSGNIYANEIMFTVEIRGVTINGGIIYGAIYSNNNAYRNNQPEYFFMGNPENEIVCFNLRIPAGQYVIKVYQDANNNGQLDFGWFNIPKEPVGITNYNGRGIPGNFDKLKVTIYNEAIIVVTINQI